MKKRQPVKYVMGASPSKAEIRDAEASYEGTTVALGGGHIRGVKVHPHHICQHQRHQLTQDEIHLWKW